MSAAGDTYVLLRAFCDELVRCGMRHACTSPGSRNTPLTLSLVRETRLRCFSHIDERSAGFFAVGAAKASGLPVALTCTSGTAVANLAPAVIEAHQARVPLIVLSADRPPELREIGAGQTIDQIKLFGGAVRWFFEVGTHEASADRVRWIRALACRAYFTALSTPAGPVHLNFSLREPLVADEPLPADPSPGRPDGEPWVRLEESQAGGSIELPAERTVIVAGAGTHSDLPEQAAGAGVPVLADPLSGARRGPAAIAHYDLLLRSPDFVGAHPPARVIRTGELPTSKPLRAWLAALGSATEQVALDPEFGWQDPDAQLGRRVGGDRLAFSAPSADGTDWLSRWRSADEAVRAAVDGLLDDELSEPLVAARLTEWLPAQTTLFIASSMPIRDVEEFSPAVETPPRMLSNRGANGIDGTVSAAFGVAAASAGPVVLLIGDVALAHDLGSLLAARRLALPLTILLLNNDGGGIFHFLPVAGQHDAFEEHVATPHGLDFAHAAALYGCAHVRVNDLAALRESLQRSVSESYGTTIIEIATEREANLALHRRLAQAADAVLAS